MTSKRPDNRSGYQLKNGFLLPLLLLCSFAHANGSTLRTGAIGQAVDTLPSGSGIIPSQFPGGREAWVHYLIKTLRYPLEAQSKDIQGRVIVKFVVDKKGKLKDIDAISGAKELRKEAIRVVKESGRWVPATENGQPIESEKEQAITFSLSRPNDSQPKSLSNAAGAPDTSLATTVEIESSFPGGASAWSRYLNRQLHYPDEAVRRNIQGTVIVQFIVDKDGNVSNIEAVAGPLEGGLREETIRVIRRSGKWLPATKDGVPVTSYKKQPLTYSLGR